MREFSRKGLLGAGGSAVRMLEGFSGQQCIYIGYRPFPAGTPRFRGNWNARWLSDEEKCFSDELRRFFDELRCLRDEYGVGVR